MLICVLSRGANAFANLMRQIPGSLLKLNAVQCPSTNRVSPLTTAAKKNILTLMRTTNVSLGWVYNSYEELLLLWSFAEDLESFELAGTEAATLVLGNVRFIFTNTQSQS